MRSIGWRRPPPPRIPTRRSGAYWLKASRSPASKRCRPPTTVTARPCERSACGPSIANAINTFDPEEVVLGGGAAGAGELLLEPARHVARGYVLPGLGTRTRIRLAWHGVRAGVLGAALLAAHELEAPSTHAPMEVGR